MKWSDGGQTFTMTYTMLLDFNGQTNEIKGVETRTLADGGKTLISQNNSTSSFGDLATKAVYEKKQLLLLSVVVIHFLLFVKLWSLNIISYIDLKMNLRKFYACLA